MATHTFFDSWTTIVYIFLNGPLKLYLEIKEGKTSVKKLVEEFEDERNIVHQRMGVKKPDLLPTNGTQNGLIKRKKGEGDKTVTTEASDY